MLLSVTAGDLSHPAVIAPVPDDQTDDALVVLPTSAETITVKDEDELISALSKAGKGDIIQLTIDINLSGTMTVENGKEITLDLNGFNLARPKDASTNFSVITNNGTLTVIDSSAAGTGTITGGTGTQSYSNFYGGGIYNNGTLTINGGTITGNSVNSYGGGIYNKGTLTINGGTIEGNSAANGGGISNSKTLTINGGTITGNSATNSGGGIIFYDGTSLILGGDAVITGNTKGEMENNIYLSSGKTITISTEAPLEERAAFGVTLKDGAGTFTGTAAESDVPHFTADADDKAVAYDAENNSIKLV